MQVLCRIDIATLISNDLIDKIQLNELFNNLFSETGIIVRNRKKGGK